MRKVIDESITDSLLLTLAFKLTFTHTDELPVADRPQLPRLQAFELNGCIHSDVRDLLYAETEITIAKRSDGTYFQNAK